MFAGFGAGSLFRQPPDIRKRLFRSVGSGFLLVFFFLRFFNLYGDQNPWTLQSSNLFSVMSFLNLSKYPPSLQYTLLTLGIMLLLLAAAESPPNRIGRILLIYGKVPLFYYVVHWYVIHLLLFALLFLQGYQISDFEFGFNFGRPASGGGLPLWGVYLFWIGVVALLYPLCVRYGKYKQKNSHIKWLKYL